MRFEPGKSPFTGKTLLQDRNQVDYFSRFVPLACLGVNLDYILSLGALLLNQFEQLLCLFVLELPGR